MKDAESAKIRQLDSKIPTFFTAKDIMKLYGLFILGLLPFHTPKNLSLQLPFVNDDYIKMKLHEGSNSWKTNLLYFTPYQI